MTLPGKWLPVLQSRPKTFQNNMVSDMEMKPVWQPKARKIPDTALLSEHSLARDWLKPEEDQAWDYL